MATGAKFTRKGHEAKLNAMIQRAKTPDAFLNRVAYPAYQNYQANRWMTENMSDGGWDALNKDYAKSKLTRFAAYPGSGRSMMVATGALVASVIGPGFSMPFLRGASQFHRKVVSGSKMVISTSIPYAQYAEEARTFTRFKKSFISDLGQKYKAWVGRG